MGQLALDGREVEGPVPRRGPPPLSRTQREVLTFLRVVGRIRTVEAGVIVHAGRRGGRGSCAGMGAGWSGWEGKGLACCPYAAADGLEMMKRLAARGLARRGEARGTWLPPE